MHQQRRTGGTQTHEIETVEVERLALVLTVAGGNCGSIVPLLCIMAVQRHFHISVSFDVLLTQLS